MVILPIFFLIVILISHEREVLKYISFLGVGIGQKAYKFSEKSDEPLPKKKKKTNNYHCCVPMCNNDTCCDDSLSFHLFPGNEQLSAKWLHKIRRDAGKFFQVSYPAFICTSLKP